MIFILLLGSILLCTVKEAAAYCTTVNNITFSMPSTLTVPRDVPVGSQIGSEIAVPSATLVSGCPAKNDTGSQDIGIKTYQSYATTINGRRIYDVPGMAGIGFALGFSGTNNCSAVQYIGRNDGTSFSGIDSQKTCANSGYWSTVTGIFYLAFYKTAEVTGSGTASSFQLGTFIMQTPGYGWQQPEPALIVTGLSVKTTACSVSNSVINVVLPTTKSTDFGDVGSNAGSKAFDIGLNNCDAGLNVSMTLSAGNAGSSDKSLGLLSADSTSSTSGLALQLMYNNAPVTLDSAFSVLGSTTTSGGSYQIPLAVRYYKTAVSIESGTINSSATFTMTYN